MRGIGSWVRRLRVASAVLVLLLASAGRGGADVGGRERWLVVEIGGEAVGSLQEKVEVAVGGSRTLAQSRLVLNRMGSRVEMASSSTIEESVAGRLTGAVVEVQLSEQTTRLEVAVDAGTATLTQTAGGQSFVRDVALEGEVLGPEGLRRLSVAGLAKVGDSIEFQTFVPDLMTFSRGSRRVVATSSFEREGRAVPVLEVEERMQASSLPTTLWLDGEGRVVRVRQPSPFGSFELRLADRAQAERAATNTDELPEEIFGGTLVHTGLEMPRARELEALELELTHKDPELGWPALARPGQTVLVEEPGRVVLALERRYPAVTRALPLPAGPAAVPELAANAYLQADEPRLRAQAAAIVGEERDLFTAARKLERWVHETMTFDAGIVLSPSVEVFENRRGTCMGYAVLLTTLARAAGIPARIVLGYVYYRDFLGGHAWTEVRVGDDWIPLDAALPAEGPADAGRFVLLESSLDEGVGMLTGGPQARLYGHLAARVLSFRLSGEATNAPETPRVSR